MVPLLSFLYFVSGLGYKEMIANGCEDDGLYLLESDTALSSLLAYQTSSSVRENKTRLMQCHN